MIFEGQEETVLGVRIDTLPDSTKKAFDFTVKLGVREAQEYLRETFQTRGGITKPKTRTDKASDEASLATIVSILDHGFVWRGPFGYTPSSIRMELIDRAQKSS